MWRKVGEILHTLGVPHRRRHLPHRPQHRTKNAVFFDIAAFSRVLDAITELCPHSRGGRWGAGWGPPGRAVGTPSSDAEVPCDMWGPPGSGVGTPEHPRKGHGGRRRPHRTRTGEALEHHRRRSFTTSHIPLLLHDYTRPSAPLSTRILTTLKPTPPPSTRVHPTPTPTTPPSARVLTTLKPTTPLSTRPQASTKPLAPPSTRALAALKPTTPPSTRSQASMKPLAPPIATTGVFRAFFARRRCRRFHSTSIALRQWCCRFQTPASHAHTARRAPPGRPHTVNSQHTIHVRPHSAPIPHARLCVSWLLGGRMCVMVAQHSWCFVSVLRVS